MLERLFRVVELIFTAYAVPALMVPFVWLAIRLLKAIRPVAPTETGDRLNRAVFSYTIVSAAWIAAWITLLLGVPLEAGGKAAGVLSWVAYGVLNTALAALLVRFTASYGGLPEGGFKDRLFLRFITAIVVQPLATAGAFAVLFRIMGVVYHLKFPALAGVQEGI
jgi:hypothetical protein